MVDGTARSSSKIFAKDSKSAGVHRCFLKADKSIMFVGFELRRVSSSQIFLRKIFGARSSSSDVFNSGSYDCFLMLIRVTTCLKVMLECVGKTRSSSPAEMGIVHKNNTLENKKRRMFMEGVFL